MTIRRKFAAFCSLFLVLNLALAQRSRLIIHDITPAPLPTNAVIHSNITPTPLRPTPKPFQPPGSSEKYVAAGSGLTPITKPWIPAGSHNNFVPPKASQVIFTPSGSPQFIMFVPGS